MEVESNSKRSISPTTPSHTAAAVPMETAQMEEKEIESESPTAKMEEKEIESESPTAKMKEKEIESESPTTKMKPVTSVMRCGIGIKSKSPKMTKEEIEAKFGKKSAKMEADTSVMVGGLITEEMVEEEKQLHQQTVEEEEKLKQDREESMTSMDEDLKEQRYKRLQFLLTKSNMYTNYLLQRMKKQEELTKVKQERKVKKETKDKENSVKEIEKTSNETEGKETASDTPLSPKPVRTSSRVKASPAPTITKNTRRAKKKSVPESDSQPSQDSAQDENKESQRKGRKRKAADQVDNYKISDYFEEALARSKRKKVENEEKCDENNTEKDEPEATADKKTIIEKTEEPLASSSSQENAEEDTPRYINGEEVHEDQPELFTGGVLRNYQLEGYNWLRVLYENGVNGILADEMGLGKTIQCIASVADLVNKGVPGPFLVCAPLSTVPNWVSEFERFAPKVPVILYHGSKEDRETLRRKISKPVTVKPGIAVRPVVITSYEIIMNDRAHIHNHEWKYIIVDEGHRIKNFQCRLIKELKLYKSTHRLLLTGTPLQNNLAELWSLLNFLLPEIFDDLASFETWFDLDRLQSGVSHQQIVLEEQKNSILSMLHQILMPFMLRRLKSDVDLVIPPKREILVYAPLTKCQETLYRAAVDKTLEKMVNSKKGAVEEPIELDKKGRPKRRSSRQVNYSAMLAAEENEEEPEDENDESLDDWVKAITEKPSSGKTTETKVVQKSVFTVNLRNIMMLLRKCCNHSYLLEYPIDQKTGQYEVTENLVKASGKFLLLDRMLPEMKKRGHKVLIFSQMTSILDLLEEYCYLRKWDYSRLDGTMHFEERRDQMDKFNKDENVFLFLLSTRAGGLGINLTSADTVVIFDSDWNPQADLQAQDRCHRIGQTRPVMVYRLITANTIDQKIVERAAAKRKLEKMVILKGKFKKGIQNVEQNPEQKVKPMNPQELLALLEDKDYDEVVKGRENKVISNKDLERLLDRSELQEIYDERKAAAEGKKLIPKTKTAKKNKQTKTEVEGVFKILDNVENQGIGSSY